MNIRKIIPIVIAVLLFILAVLLFVKNNTAKKVSYEKLVVTFNGTNTDYSNVGVNNVIKVGNTKLYVVAVQKDSLVLTSDANIIIGGKEVTDIEVKSSEKKDVCSTNNECFSLSLE